MDSILTSIKKILGLPEEYDAFDPDIIIHINSTLGILSQLGIGPEEGFMIFDASSTWDEFLINFTNVEFVKSYVSNKVKLLFDPPQNSSTLEALKEMTSELEWRLSVAATANKKADDIFDGDDDNE